jgi:hypothetical protein
LEGLQQHHDRLKEIAEETVAQFPGAVMEYKAQEQYRNMKQVLDTCPQVAAYAEEAIQRAGLTVKKESIRGGTDGSSPEIKEVFLSAGAPESVNSSVASERFGAYLVSRGVLRAAELEMALGMLPHFSGKLGDTLVGLGLLRPLDVFRQLSQQVRDRVIDLFRWSSGSFAFFRGVKNEQESFPLGLDGFEILGAGVLTVPAEQLELRFQAMHDGRPRRAERRRIDPDAFRLGPTPREVLALLDGERPLHAWLQQFSAPDERVTFLRSLYLLIETDLAELD